MFNLTASWLIAAFIFVNAIPYTPAARYLLLGFLLLLTLIGLAKRQFTAISKNPLVLGLSAFSCVALLSAFCSPYIIDSLQGFRKEYLPALFVILVSASLKQAADERQRFANIVLWALLAGYGVKTGLAFWDGAVIHPFVFSPYSNSDFFEKNGLPRYVSYYAVESVLYFTLAYSVLCFLCDSWSKRFVLLLICSISFFILTVSGIRSALVATLIGLLITTLIKLRTPKKFLGFCLMLFMIAGAAVFFGKDNIETIRYIDLIKAEAYSKEQGMSGRYPIWEGVGELVAQRPLLGFGPGWQKIPTAAKDYGLIGKWQSSDSLYSKKKYEYFSLESGKANPHNLGLQVLFETGWIGLLAYLIMLATLFWCALTTQDKQNKTPFSQWLKFATIAYFAALFVIDLTNAFLLHNTTIALMIITVLIKSPTSQNTIK